MTLSRKERAQVKAKFDGKCAYCGSELGDKWHVDHIEPVMRIGGDMEHPERDIIENMHPACIPCNMFKGGMPLETFRDELQLQVERGRKTSVNFRMAEKYNQIVVLEQSVSFWFELVEPNSVRGEAAITEGSRSLTGGNDNDQPPPIFKN